MWIIANANEDRFLDWEEEGPWPKWTEDRNRALNFVRRADAERLAAGCEDAWKILKHCALLPESFSDMVADAMQDAWNNICDDTGHHPLDIKHGAGRHLTFEPAHWATLTGKLLGAKLEEVVSREELPPANDNRGATTDG